MPLVRTWVITDYLFLLADLLYLSRDGMASFYASCMIIFGLATFFASYNLFTFSPFHLSFPCPSKRPTARWQLTKWLTAVDGLLRVDCYFEQAHYLTYQTFSPHLFASCHWYLPINPINPCQPNNDSFVFLLMVLAIRQLNYAIQF